MQKAKRVRPPHYAKKSRSLSLRACSFVESRPGRSEFVKRGDAAPKTKKVRKRETRAHNALMLSGDALLASIATRR